MNNKEIEQGIARAIDEQTPDVLDKILLEYRSVTRKEEIMNVNQNLTETEVLNENEKIIDITDKIIKQEEREKIASKPRLLTILAGVAAVAVIAFAGIFGYNNLMTDYTIGIDVNPSVEINVNRKEDVIKITPLNAEGIAIVDGMDLKGVDLDIAVNALVGSMLKQGFVDDAKNSILVTVENTDQQRGGEVQKRIATEIESTLKNYSVAGAIMSQTVSNSSGVKSIANEYGISIGKANLINQLVAEDPTLLFGNLAKLSINDLNLISETRTPNLASVSSSGAASSTAYIGADKAKEIAVNHGGITEAELKSSKVKMDSDDGIMVYEVEFVTDMAEYDYDINASTGAVISHEIEFYNLNNNTPTTAVNITIEQAKKVALDHAGFTESQVTLSKAKSDFNNGREEYEIEFYVDNIEYDYEIDAKTGAIISADQDTKNYTSAKPEVAPSTTTPSPSANITLEQAKKIALDHAGLTESRVTFVKAKSDWDDGREEYEIEFYSGNMEYDYEIDATTGEILSFDNDAEDYSKLPSSSANSSSTPGASTAITADQAKEIAFKHAGVSADNVYDLEVDDDYENNTYIYEVDFKSGNIEYEYDINASTGEILKAKKELDD